MSNNYKIRVRFEDNDSFNQHINNIEEIVTGAFARGGVTLCDGSVGPKTPGLKVCFGVVSAPDSMSIDQVRGVEVPDGIKVDVIGENEASFDGTDGLGMVA